jgi:hypothetical protein
MMPLMAVKPAPFPQAYMACKATLRAVPGLVVNVPTSVLAVPLHEVFPGVASESPYTNMLSSLYSKTEIRN